MNLNKFKGSNIFIYQFTLDDELDVLSMLPDASVLTLSRSGDISGELEDDTGGGAGGDTA